MRMRHPAQRLQVAQAARAFLEVGLEVVGGVAEARMARALFVALGLEVFARRPQLSRRRSRARSARSAASSPASGRASSSAVSTVMSSRAASVHCAERAHRVADRQAGVPQQREEARRARRACALLRVGFGQHQQVDVGLREQFAAAVAADREQRQRRVGRRCSAPRRRATSASTARARSATRRVDVLAAGRNAARSVGVGLRRARARAASRHAASSLGARQASRPAAAAAAPRSAHRSLSSPGTRVRISTPSSVTATVCSHCADS